MSEKHTQYPNPTVVEAIIEVYLQEPFTQLAELYDRLKDRYPKHYNDNGYIGSHIR